MRQQQYRADLNLWEEKKFRKNGKAFYEYSIFYNGSLFVTRFTNQKRRGVKRYIKIPYVPPVIRIGREEFKKIYNNNKWLVPLNKELDLKLP